MTGEDCASGTSQLPKWLNQENIAKAFLVFGAVAGLVIAVGYGVGFYSVKETATGFLGVVHCLFAGFWGWKYGY